MKRKILFLFVVLACLSCEKVLNVTLPYEGNKFVIYGELSPQNVISVQIERTYPPTGEVEFTMDYLNETQVILLEDSKEIETLKRIANTTIFTSAKQFKPKEGKSYQIRVKAPNFFTALSEPQTIPPPVQIKRAGFVDKVVFSPLNERTPTKFLEIEFEKPSTKGIYLVSELVAQYQGMNTSSNIISDMTIPEFGNPCIYPYSSRRKIFNGDCFTKERNILNFFVELKGTAETLPNQYQEVTVDAVSIKLSSSNKFYLDFYSQLSPTEGIFKAFETARKTVTNIKDGYGAILVKNEATFIYKL